MVKENVNLDVSSAIFLNSLKSSIKIIDSKFISNSAVVMFINAINGKQ